MQLAENVVGVWNWFKGLKERLPNPTVKVGEFDFKLNENGTLGDRVVIGVAEQPIYPPTLELKTLTGLVDAFASKVDDFDAGVCAVQVESFRSVAIVALKADGWGHRHVFARAESAEVNPFPFDEFQEPELFRIKAQMGFLPMDGNFVNMLKLCESLRAGSAISVADDGFSQKVVVEEGGVQRGAVELPPRIGLQPYRTFREIDPVESDFLLRFKARNGALPQVALIQLDAGRWKTDTAHLVAKWLTSHLPVGTKIIA